VAGIGRAVRIRLAELRREAVLQAAHDISGLGAIQGRLDGRLLVHEGQIADADGLAGDELDWCRPMTFG